MKTYTLMLLALLFSIFVANHAFAQNYDDILKNYRGQNHPEQGKDELFLVNAFEPLEPEYLFKKRFGCKTLRFGKKAYRDNEDADTVLLADYHPVFIKHSDPCVKKLPKPEETKLIKILA